MLRTIIRLEKLAALRRRFLWEGMLTGSTAAHFAVGQDSVSDSDNKEMMPRNEDAELDINGDMGQEKQGINERLGDAGPESGPQSLSSITLAAKPGMF